MKNIYFFIFTILLCCVSGLAQTKVTISGSIADATTGEPLQGASIYTTNGKYGDTSDSRGRFSFSAPTGSTISLEFSYVGYETQVKEIQATHNQRIDVALVRGNRLRDITVHGKADFGVESSQMSAVNVPMLQVKAMPALFGEVDAMKALQKLPGVQSTGDGQSGIYVRGGEYDQNMITIDGATLYNSEHLMGYTSALNAEMIESMVFYKGAFPARYGSRLSSVIDISLKEGDFERYHAALNLGVLSSSLNVEGPIIKGKTSFNLAARASYLGAIVMPVLEKVYDDDDALQPYVNMNFYDINAKIVHRFSARDKLSATVYYGKDINNDSTQVANRVIEEQPDPTSDQKTGYQYSARRFGNTDNKWHNMVANLVWQHIVGAKMSFDLGFNYSQYRYRKYMGEEIHNANYSYEPTESPGEHVVFRKKLDYKYDEVSYSDYHSDIDDYSLTFNLRYRPSSRHDVRIGAAAGFQRFSPIVDSYKDYYYYNRQSDTNIHETESKTTGKSQDNKTMYVYAEDDWDIVNHLRINPGLRYSAFILDGKTYHSIEPRFSMRYLILHNLSVKASYSRMAQAVHLLESSNLIMPSSLWVLSTDRIPLMKSDQYGLSLDYEPIKGLELQVEGYYKKLYNVLDYRSGASYAKSIDSWEQIVAVGDGRTYGVEFFLQKKTGSTTGWIGYTWSKSLCTFNHHDNVLNGGREFFAGSDRRHNFNILVTQQIGRHWSVSAAWTFQTGRRGNVYTTEAFNGIIKEHIPFRIDTGQIPGTSSDIYSYFEFVKDPYAAAYYSTIFNYLTYQRRNGYVLPNIHRLDLSATYTIKVRRVENSFCLSLYNVYNRMNASEVYSSFENDKPVLAALCKFPFLPSINYILKF